MAMMGFDSVRFFENPELDAYIPMIPYPSRAF
jgi:hypothetical protein